MNTAKLRSLLVMATAGIALAFPAGSALADKPEWAGGGKQKKEKSHQEGREEGRVRDDRQGTTLVIGFGSDERRIVSDYYGAQARAGKCPLSPLCPAASRRPPHSVWSASWQGPAAQPP